MGALVHPALKPLQHYHQTFYIINQLDLYNNFNDLHVPYDRAKHTFLLFSLLPKANLTTVNIFVSPQEFVLGVPGAVNLSRYEVWF